MLQVFLAEYRLLHRYAPVNAKGFVFDVDAAICLGMIELVTLVLEDGGLGENGEAMSKASGNEKLPIDSGSYFIAR